MSIVLTRVRLICSALFDILRESTVELRNLDGEALRKKAKYAELVMKVWDSHCSFSALSLQV